MSTFSEITYILNCRRPRSWAWPDPRPRSARSFTSWTTRTAIPRPASADPTLKTGNSSLLPLTTELPYQDQTTRLKQVKVFSHSLQLNQKNCEPKTASAYPTLRTKLKFSLTHNNWTTRTAVARPASAVQTPRLEQVKVLSHALQLNQVLPSQDLCLQTPRLEQVNILSHSLQLNHKNCEPKTGISRTHA